MPHAVRMFLVLLLTGCEPAGDRPLDGMVPPPSYGAFYEGPYPDLVEVAYQDHDGTERAVTAYAGQIVVVATADGRGVVVPTIERAGTILAGHHDSGVYLVQVTPGSERAAIASLDASHDVATARPNGPIAPAQMGAPPPWPGCQFGDIRGDPVVEGRLALYVVDDFGLDHLPCDNGLISMATHGERTSFVATRGLPSQGAAVCATNAASDFNLVQAVAFAILDSAGRLLPTVVNLSFGVSGDYNGDGVPEYSASQVAEFERGFLDQLAAKLDHLTQGPPEEDRLLERTLLVVAAGNGGSTDGGADLSGVLHDLRTTYPRVFIGPRGSGEPHLVVVGGSGPEIGVPGGDPACTINRQANHADLPMRNFDQYGIPTMLYAPDQRVQVDASGCTAPGTSYAAPAVSNRVAHLLLAYPDREMREIVEGFVHAERLLGCNTWTGTANVTSNARCPSVATGVIDTAIRFRAFFPGSAERADQPFMAELALGGRSFEEGAPGVHGDFLEGADGTWGVLTMVGPPDLLADTLFYGPARIPSCEHPPLYNCSVSSDGRAIGCGVDSGALVGSPLYATIELQAPTWWEPPNRPAGW